MTAGSEITGRKLILWVRGCGNFWGEAARAGLKIERHTQMKNARLVSSLYAYVGTLTPFFSSLFYVSSSFRADDVSNLKNTPTRIRTYTALMRTVCTWESSLRRLYVVFASPHGLSEHRNTGNRRPSVFKIGSKRYRALSYTYSENQKTENRKQENNTKTMRKKNGE